MNDPASSVWRPNGDCRITESSVEWVSTAPMPSTFLFNENEDFSDLVGNRDSMGNTKQNKSHQKPSVYRSMLDKGSMLSTEGEIYPTSFPQDWTNFDYSSHFSNMQNATFPSGDQIAGQLRTAPASDSSSTTGAAGHDHVPWSLERVINRLPTSLKPQGNRPISLSKRRVIGNGIMSRKERLKARSSPIHKFLEEKRIRKNTGTVRCSLLNALNLIEQLRGELDIESDVFSRLALPISQLEESVGEELLRQTRASRTSSTSKGYSGNIGFADHLVADSVSFGDTTSMSETSGFSHQYQTRSSTSVTSCDEVNGEEYSMNTTMDMETPRAQQPTTAVYHCTFESNGMLCNFTTKFKCDWIRHEESEKHWPQKRYMCLLCIEVIADDNGNPQCKFCSEPLLAFGNNKTHYLQCKEARNKGRHLFAAARDEHFRTHLRRFHAKQGIDAEAATWNFVVQSKWPKQCGFCSRQFDIWEERSSHIALHFEQGMDISSWRPQSRKPKKFGDHRPGIDPHKRDGDDDDDDDDENHHPDHGSGNRHRQEYSMSYTSSASSPQQTNSTQFTSNGWRGWALSGSLESDSKENISRAKVEKYLQEHVQIPGNTVPDFSASPIEEAFDSQSSFEIETPDEFNTAGTNAIESQWSLESQVSNETDTVETITSYSPLAYSDSIRLLTLHPAKNSGSQLRCDISTFRLSEAPLYTALSHCWGSSAPSVTLETPTGHIKISKHLASALCQTQSLNHKFLWVDSLCINHVDKSEVQSQIYKMTQIYEQAEQTLVWLETGEDDICDELDIDSLKQTLLSRNVHKNKYFKSLITSIKNHDIDSTLLNLYFAGNSLIGMQGWLSEEFFRVWNNWLELSFHMDSLERVQTRLARCQFPRCSYSKLLTQFGESVSHKGPYKKQLVSQPQSYIEVDNKDDKINGKTSSEV